jgi:hypothetical protein
LVVPSILSEKGKGIEKNLTTTKMQGRRTELGGSKTG